MLPSFAHTVPLAVQSALLRQGAPAAPVVLKLQFAPEAVNGAAHCQSVVGLVPPPGPSATWTIPPPPGLKVLALVHPLSYPK